ncbi:hypothetical protein QR680_011584 [Steinernema hermaphroditum]|uniref:Uncharacterized protein n=1 Tax=Steinernema hermaphroditum TaxID=289476 RepID=A0AA39LYX5_9BILA|nr:hypothetical protein QR680_011584 [Steinernema hermaphroditum]
MVSESSTRSSDCQAPDRPDSPPSSISHYVIINDKCCCGCSYKSCGVIVAVLSLISGFALGLEGVTRISDHIDFGTIALIIAILEIIGAVCFLLAIFQKIRHPAIWVYVGSIMATVVYGIVHAVVIGPDFSTYSYVSAYFDSSKVPRNHPDPIIMYIILVIAELVHIALATFFIYTAFKCKKKLSTFRVPK